ncbi:general substrate transporter [Aspergillus granulosus]|uniref:General substrate transporter n=1 Tax=Aspergillus granulosus TaxID=176169 RepID=A0ABR4HUS9_9EURO
MGTNTDSDRGWGQEPRLGLDLEQARCATEHEHALSLTDALRTYRKSVCWSMLFSLAIIMEGYDTTLLQSFFAFPMFVRKYGSPVYSDSEAGEIASYELSAAWQSGLSNGAYVGEIFGLFVTGLLSERVGYRCIMASATLSLAGFVFVLFFAPDLPTLLVGEILCGVPWGVFQTVTTAYAAEVCPVVLRGYLTTYVNLCWVIGQFIATGVLRGFLHREDEWSYRIPFALQWVWLPFILISVWLGPESPWWLVRKGRIEEAREVLNRLHYTSSKSNSPKMAENELDNTLALMVYTSEMEKQLLATQSSYTFLDCFRSTNLRRTEITCITWAVQALCGSSFMGYSTYFYQQAGLDVSQSFNMSLGQYGFGVVGTIFSWVLMSRFGRRSLYVSGLGALVVTLFAVGFTSLSDTTATGWAIGSLLLVFTFTYDCTIGPVCYSIVAEIPSTQMRAKTIVLARNVYNMFMIMNGVIVPRMLNPTAWNWKGRAGFFWAGIAAVLFIWTYFRLPETKERTFAEMDILFERKVSARRFKDTEVRIDDVQPRATD